MKHHALAVLTLVGSLLAVAPASAMKYSFVLDQPVLGMDASGVGQVTSLRGKETFKVRVFADVKDETTFLVLVGRHGANIGDQDGLTPVGKIQMKLGSGLLELDTDAHISPVFPIQGIQRVVIQYKGNTILEGRVFEIGPAD